MSQMMNPSWIVGLSTAAALLSLVAIVELLLLWRILRAARSWRQIEERVAHFGKVLTLLTETTETGFGALAAELRRRDERMTVTPAHPWTHRRRARSTGRSQTTGDAARPAAVSEGEASLRSYLKNRGHSDACPCASCAADTAVAGAR